MAETAKTADLALSILIEVVERGPISVADLVRVSGLNRTIVYRLLTTLRVRGFIVQGPFGYSGGPTTIRLGEMTEPLLRTAAADAIANLAHEVGETIVLAIPDGGYAVTLLQQIATQHILSASHPHGARYPLDQGAGGRALLAFLPERMRKGVVEKADDPSELEQKLREIQQCGYAVSHDELQAGVHGISLPVRGSDGFALASLTMLVPSTRAEGCEHRLALLSSVAQQIEARLA